jgi:hypothetical protein
VTKAIALAALAVAAAPGPPAFERVVRVEKAGRAVLVLDRDVYESARADLGDLRLVDPSGREVPYVLDRGGSSARRGPVRPDVRNRGWRADGAATAVLDFGGRVAKRRLTLRLSGDDFRRPVSVEGSEDGREWTTLVDEAWVFAVPGEDAARYETVELPENDFPLLRVAARPAPDERSRPAIVDALVPGGEPLASREAELRTRWTAAHDARSGETWLTLDLGARHHPFTAIVLDVGDERFFREVRVDARRDIRPADPEAWDEVGRGQVHRLERGGRVREGLRVGATGRARTLRVRVRDGDDRPLEVRDVSVAVPLERILFEATAPGAFRLTWGAPARAAPRYDLARTIGDLEEWGRSARAAAAEPPRRLAPSPPADRPWTERHPAVAWAGLVAVVLLLGGLTWRVLRRTA